MQNKNSKQRGLGRGLSALMADVTDRPADNPGDAKAHDMMVPIEQIVPNPDQPRRRFDAELLDDLAASIREKGII